jgi:hypothetical protein
MSKPGPEIGAALRVLLAGRRRQGTRADLIDAGHRFARAAHADGIYLGGRPAVPAPPIVVDVPDDPDV